MSTTALASSDEFTSTMKRLVEEAEKTVARAGEENAGVMQRELTSLSERMTRLEKSMAAGFDKMSTALAKGGDSSGQLERLDENLRALRSTESVNQRLFDSLHSELKAYRDNFLRDSLQKPVIRDLVVLYDDLSGLAASLHLPASKGGAAKAEQLRGNLENAIHTLVEILHRLEVNVIEPRDMMDRALHRVVGCEPANDAEEDGRIVKRLKAGFMWHDQVLRPEEVVVKRCK